MIFGYPCWEWQGAVNSAGYGAAYAGGRTQGAHRVVYELLVGPIPEGLEIDHLCRNRLCVNPAHLEAVTRSENIKRSGAGGNKGHRVPTHCPHGHPYDEANTGYSCGRRHCRTCKRERSTRERAARNG